MNNPRNTRLGQESEALLLERWRPSARQSPEWAQGLAELSKSLSDQRAYLHPRDDSAREAYYQGIVRDAAPGRLFDELSRLARESHQRVRIEMPMRLIYSWVDLRPDGDLRCLFSDQAYEPGELMRLDHLVCLARVREIRRAASLELSGEALARELARIEAHCLLNCVEAVPQAWHRGNVNRRVDLHQRFVCAVEAQRFRGDRSYGECRTLSEATRSASGSSAGGWFEPSSSSGKGAVARAVLYFLLRYPGVLEAGRFGPSASALRTLRLWHAEHPVTDHECHRNQTIFGLQGNRNPLIDHPEWADRIDFRRALR